MLGLRKEARAALASLVGSKPEQVSLTGSTTDGCNIVLAGLDLGPEDEIVTTREEHFGLLGPVHASGARVAVVDAEPEAILAAVTPRTRLLALSHVLWTTGRLLPVRRAPRADRRAGTRRRGAVRRRDPRRRGRARLPDHLRPEVALRPGRDRRARRRRPGAAARRAAELLLAGLLRARPAGSSPPRARRASIPVGSRPRTSPGSWPHSSCRPSGASTAPPSRRRAAGSVLAPLVDVVPGDATLVAFRAEDPPALVATLFDAGVVVRDLPGTGLVRVSCGWWTSDEDVDRLAAALP